MNAAVLNLTKCLADRGVRDGVRVNAINPGSIRTDRLAARIRQLANEKGVTEEEAARTYQVGDLLVILSPVRESLSAEALAYTRHPRPKGGRFTSHDVKKMSPAEIGRLLEREGLLAPPAREATT